ncbi:LAFE_0H02366g1_1 [Lachancea fermentati]|uniref:LAFE_0H02366g1_1 n=1 Tax=Lachancea fermentati TaxID=4955 RepID=A0A1G4MJK9_LACFM|nr:LAFE_0H02366g1_1 [Lachancea fermentati]
MKICYYELLGVESNASDGDLRKAYRKKALQYHPDKNPGNIEEATAIFATIRSAYEVLSDPQERAWYDSHKNQILSDDVGPNADDEEYEYEVDATVTGITTDELLKFFNSALYTRIDDTPAGLYQIAGKVFAKLASDEVKAGRRAGLSNFDKYQDDFFETEINSMGYKKAFDKYSKMNESTLFPQFGDSTTDFQYLRGFYQKWGSFGTVKTFSWKDEYMYSRNYDRRTKREINKRNEKLRQQAKSEYNKTVKRFVTFIKKFDKRMKEGAKRFEQEKRKKLQEDLRKQIEKDRQANLKNASDPFKLQSWQTVDQEEWDEIERHFDEFIDKNTGEDDSEEEIVIYECFICNKNFKSEKQLENHTNTKAHKKTLRKVKWEMKKDSMVLGLDELSDVDDFNSADEFESEEVNELPVENEELEEHETTPNMSELDRINEELSKIERELENISSDDSLVEVTNSVLIEVDDVIESDTVESETSEIDKETSKAENTPKAETSPSQAASAASEDDEEESEDELSKLLASLKNGDDESDGDAWDTSKFKQKKQKKKAKSPPQSSNTTQLEQHSCGTCRTTYQSRNALFKHINSSGHAAPPSKLKKPKARKQKR